MFTQSCSDSCCSLILACVNSSSTRATTWMAAKVHGLMLACMNTMSKRAITWMAARVHGLMLACMNTSSTRAIAWMAARIHGLMLACMNTSSTRAITWMAARMHGLMLACILTRSRLIIHDVLVDTLSLHEKHTHWYVCCAWMHMQPCYKHIFVLSHTHMQAHKAGIMPSAKH